MNNILIICSNLFDDSDANGVCTNNICDEFLSRGNNIFCITDSLNNERYIEKTKIKEKPMTVFGLKQAWYTRWQKNNAKKKGTILTKVVPIMRHFIVLFLYPNVSPIRSLQMLMLAKRIISKNKINKVIVTYRPFESIFTALLLKVIYADKIEVFAYHYDFLTSPNDTNKVIRSYKKLLGNVIVKLEKCVLDRIIVPDLKNEFDTEREVHVGFPLFVERKIVPCDFNFSNNYINISYVGSLDEINRNPKDAFEQLRMASYELEKPIKVHIWGNVSKKVEEIIAEYNFVDYYGRLNNENVSYIYDNSDFLLNISNKVTFDMLPSKIFQMFYSGKPIINYVFTEEDKSLDYFIKYGNSCQFNSCYSSKYKIIEFIKNNYSSRFEVNKSSFELCTPKYIVDKMEV